VVHLIYGSERAAGGSLAIGSVRVELSAQSPDAAIRQNVVLVPGDRLRGGAVATLTVADNLTLPVLDRSRGGWAISRQGMSRIADGLAESYDVRPRDPSHLLGQLSGGNQQKVVLAKWFQIDPELILLDEPTQGVDIGAREQVFATIRRMSAAEACIICASSDHEQLAAICDRVVVLARGRIVAEISGSAISKAAIAELCYNSFGDAEGSSA
jgi:ribose transport system ATP-binding protein